jgi:glycosyltransferase involved in cell wall biosynthesis
MIQMSTGRSAAGPRRVLYVIDELFLANAGTERQLFELIAGLDRRQYDPHLAMFRGGRDLRASGTLPCPLHELNIEKIATPAAVPRLGRLARLTRRLRAPIAHVFFNDASIAAPAFCRLAGARVIAARRDMGFWYTPAILRALRLSNQFVDVIAANSDAVRQNVHARERYPLDRIVVVPNGHDPQKFDDPCDAHLRARLGIEPHGRIVGMVANLNPWKRQADLVRAMARVREIHSDAHLVLVGTGQDFDILAQLAGTLGQGRHVHILRGISNAIPIVKLFDVAVLCSDSEGFSNAILEYAFCARPIVCTNVGGNTEVIVHNETGALVERGDVAGLAAAITALLSEPSRAAVLGANARRAVAARYTRNAMVAAHSVLYDRVLAGARAGETVLATS